MNNTIELAKSLATKFHAGQKYGNEDYTAHLGQVACSVKLGTTDERLIVVAWLHDILEDTDCPISTLAELFEDNVLAAVVAMTRGNSEDKPDYLARCKANPMARIVKVHDSLCNLQASVLRFDAKRIKKYTEQINFLVSP